MRKLAWLLALCLLALSVLAGCDGNGETTSSQPEQSAESETVSQE